jgi:hypothetical protein
MAEAQNSNDVMTTFSQMSHAMSQARMPAFNQPIRFPSFDTPIYNTNISRIGLLGVSIAADVVKVMNRAKRKEVNSPGGSSLEHKFMKAIYDTAASYKSWSSEIYHVAIRIRSSEEGWQDPGTLIESKAAREAGDQYYDSPENRRPATAPTVVADRRAYLREELRFHP